MARERLRQAPVAISKTALTPSRSDPNVFSLGHGYECLPVDLPVFIRVTRLLRKVAGLGGKAKESEGLAGHTLEITVLNGPTVYVRIGFNPDSTVKVFVKPQDAESPELVYKTERGL